MLRAYLFRKLDTAEKDGANLLIVEIDSPGGFVDDSKLMAERLRDVRWARTVAFVPREALSGAAIVALGCDDIVMGSGARLGDAGPIFLGEDFLFRHAPEKVRSDVVTLVRSLAEAKGRPPALAEAMVDMDTVVYRWTNAATGKDAYMSPGDVEALDDADQWERGPMVRASREGLFLEVHGREAVELGLAQGLAESRDELKQRYGIEGELRVLTATGVDTAVYILNLPLVTGVLFVVGLIALYFELSSPGIGFGALLAGLCFALFFWSRFLGGTAEWLELVLFAAGVVFLLIEILVLPGFGLAGIAGILLIFVSLMMAMQGFAIPETRRQMVIFANSMGVLAVSGVAFAIAAYLLRRHLGTLPVLNQLLLKPPEPARAGGLSGDADAQAGPEGAGPGVGDRGIAHTALRPAGKGRFGDRYVNVVTDSEFVKAGAAIQIMEFRGGRMYVRPC
jgi:membrane-bound serine protease (ClpP class)